VLARAELLAVIRFLFIIRPAATVDRSHELVFCHRNYVEQVRHSRFRFSGKTDACVANDARRNNFKSRRALKTFHLSSEGVYFSAQ